MLLLPNYERITCLIGNEAKRPACPIGNEAKRPACLIGNGTKRPTCPIGNGTKQPVIRSSDRGRKSDSDEILLFLN